MTIERGKFGETQNSGEIFERLKKKKKGIDEIKARGRLTLRLLKILQ